MENDIEWLYKESVDVIITYNDNFLFLLYFLFFFMQVNINYFFNRVHF